MREIKFRAWDVEREKYRFGADNLMMDLSGRLYWQFGYAEPDMLPKDTPFRIEQFTGIQDSEGVNIYEGDIVKVLLGDWLSKDDEDPRTIDQYTYDIASTGLVMFVRGCFTAHIGRDRMGYDIHESLIAQRHGFVLVIGNIHQHAHLLRSRES